MLPNTPSLAPRPRAPWREAPLARPAAGPPPEPEPEPGSLQAVASVAVPAHPDCHAAAQDAGACVTCDEALAAFRRHAREGLRGLEMEFPELAAQGRSTDAIADRLSPARVRMLGALTSALERAVGAEHGACRAPISGALVVSSACFGLRYTRRLVQRLLARLSPASHILDVQSLVCAPLTLRRAHAEAYLDALVQLRDVARDEPSWLSLLGRCLPVFEQEPAQTRGALARLVQLLRVHGAALDARCTLAVAEGLARPLDGLASQLALARLLRALCRELPVAEAADAADVAPRLSLIAQVARSSVAELRALDAAWAQLPRPRPPGLTAHAMLFAMVQVSEQLGYAAAAVGARHEARRALRTHALYFLDPQMDEAHVQQVFAAFLRAPGPAFVDVCVPLADSAVVGARRAAHLEFLSRLPAEGRSTYVQALMQLDGAERSAGPIEN